MIVVSLEKESGEEDFPIRKRRGSPQLSFPISTQVTGT
jgi:hypothetical protein